MIKGENSDSIPIDLIIDILSRLPAKSIARFRFVSKLWGSMFLRPYFTDLFLTRSSARPPRLLFAVKGNGDEWCFFTSPQPQNPYEESSSLVVTADVHKKFLGDDNWLKFCGCVSGLIYFQHQVIYNPSTGQSASLPLLPLPTWRMSWCSFLGFDPIDKRFKVLSISYPNYHQILTLGTGSDSWREIHCPLNHFPMGEGICINGVLYYLAEQSDELPSLIVCFDVRYEKFKFIHRDFIRYRLQSQLINYKGKLGVIDWQHLYSPGSRRYLKLCLWVTKDVEEPESEWSAYVYTIWEDQVVGCNVSTFWKSRFVGVTATGEIVFSTSYTYNTSEPFYVFFFNLERNTVLSVEIQGFRAVNQDAFERCEVVRVFVDHVEDIKFIMMKKTYAATSISPL